MVPVTYWVVVTIGIPLDIAIRIAFGTSLLVVLPTAISGAFRHNKNKTIRWKAALILGPCGLAGALAGAKLATYIPGEALKTGFGGLVLAAALWMGLGRMSNSAGETKMPREKIWLLAACGFTIGLVSGLSGIGGGVVIVPVLLLALNFPMHLAIGTSIASIMFISLGGTIGYSINGIGAPVLLPHSIGYVNLPIFLCLAATSIPMAQLGGRAAHALPARQLRYVFIAFMVYVGVKMLIGS